MDQGGNRKGNLISDIIPYEMRGWFFSGLEGVVPGGGQPDSE